MVKETQIKFALVLLLCRPIFFFLKDRFDIFSTAALLSLPCMAAILVQIECALNNARALAIQNKETGLL